MCGAGMSEFTQLRGEMWNYM